MESIESFFTIQKETQSLFKSKGSKFMGFVFSVNSEKEVKSKLDNVKTQHSDASHHCYAYILNADKSIQKSFDDGEPSNSAGKPIIRQILSVGITNVIVIVVRYFGGKLLGVSGLIEAYGESARIALEEAGKQEKFIFDTFKISSEIAEEYKVYQLLQRFDHEIVSNNFSDRFELIVEIKLSLTEHFLASFEKFHTLKVEKL